MRAPSEPRGRSTRIAEPVAAHGLAAVLAGSWSWAGDRAAAHLAVNPVPLEAGASAGLWGGHVLAAALLSLGVFAFLTLWASTRRLVRDADGRPRATAAGGLAALVAAAPGFLAGAALTAGAWVREQAFAPYLHAGVVLVVLAMAFAWGTLLAWSCTGRLRRIVLCSAAFSASAGAVVADAVVLPGLYPALHAALYGAGGLLAVSGGLRLAELAVPSQAALRTTAALASLGALGLGAALWFGLDDGQRAALSLASPTAGEALAVTPVEDPNALVVAALERLDPRAGTLTPPTDRAALAALTKGRRDWNVVLLVVDALRADAVPPVRGTGGVVLPGDTPFLDEWLEGAYRFRAAYAPATATVTAMPAVFHAQDVWRGGAPGGLRLPDRFRELGREPLAVTVPWFLVTGKHSCRPLLDGFGRLDFVPKEGMDALPQRVAALLRSTSERPVFAWIHVFNAHEPYYAGRAPNRGSPRERYRRAVRYTDGQLRELFATLAAEGLGDDTIVVLMGDHGECFGEHRKTGHGATVFDEDAHVPLAIHIPGTPGGVIEATVGTVDVVPTLVELLGGTPEAGLSGRSLVPLLAQPESDPERPYLLASGHRLVRGVVEGRRKLVLDTRTGLPLLFDLTVDPGETMSLLGEAPLADAALLDALYLHHADLARPALRTPSVAALLTRKLAEVDPAAPGAALPLLLRLLVVMPNPDAVAAAERLFAATSSPEARLLVVRALAEVAPARVGSLLTGRLAALRPGSEEEADFVGGLARQGQPAFAADLVRRRMGGLAGNGVLTGGGSRGSRTALATWLALVRPWPKRFGEWAPLFARVTRWADVDPTMRRLLFENVSSLQAVPRSADAVEALGRAALAAIDDPDPALAAAAVSAVGRLRYRRAKEALRTLAARQDVPTITRQALVRALAAVEGESATPLIVRLGGEIVLTVDAVAALQAVGDDRGLAFLDSTAKRHPTSDVRRQAKKAAEAVRARVARNGPSS